ncbi:MULTISPECIES: hypothetical protein [unclassified Bradyrhizobium]|uniref:hypothetical protein n=1 Tax=unclassified Bradyrhizobium TaxID=2631580 RepID=UPI0029165F6F|nr:MULTISPECIES: hypothetical protein [unclassified Bradyrhizobium]
MMIVQAPAELAALCGRHPEATSRIGSRRQSIVRESRAKSGNQTDRLANFLRPDCGDAIARELLVPQ